MTDWLEYHEKPVTLHSGGKSHWLVRGDLIFADARLREAVLDFWVGCLRHLRTTSFVLGVPTGGTPWAKALAQRIDATYVDADKELPEEGDVVVVDDGGATPGAAWARLHLPLEP